MLIKHCLTGCVRTFINETPAYCWYVWKRGRNITTGIHDVICSHIKKYCGSLQHWIVWTYIVIYKAVERGWVVHFTYLHNYLLDYLLTYLLHRVKSFLRSKPVLSYFFPHFFSSILRMQNIWSVTDLFDSFHSSGNSYLLQLLLIRQQI